MATATKSKDAELDTLRTIATEKGSCPRCHKRSTKGFIQLSVSKYGAEKSAKGSTYIKSKGRSMCGTCIKEVFVKLNSLFDEELRT